MTDETRKLSVVPETVSFADRLAASQQFQALFHEGMALVEETASYLDGDGRSESKRLERPASLAYATESMRLTTRLMQLASWLLLQRAVNEGEMSSDQASTDKNRVRLDRLSSANSGNSFDALPLRLQDLILRSVRLQERVQHLDAMLYPVEEKPAEPVPAENPVAQQIDRIFAAFGKAG